MQKGAVPRAVALGRARKRVVIVGCNARRLDMALAGLRILIGPEADITLGRITGCQCRLLVLVV